MILGIVSNCWRLQLAAGVPLESLVKKAAREGYRAIEFRQGCLGEFETATEFLAECHARYAELPPQFPDVRFNIAARVSFL